MIKDIRIHNFKIHANSDVRLAPLTIMTGINGMGKSSLTQAVLLMRAAVRSSDYPRKIPMQNRLVDIGPFTVPLVNWHVTRDDNPDVFGLLLTFGSEETDSGKTLEFKYAYDIATPDTFKPVAGHKQPDSELLEELPLFSNNFQYVSAHRIGPKNSYGLNPTAVADRQVSSAFGDGDMAPAILAQYGTEEIPVLAAAIGMEVDGKPNLRLDFQTTQWLNRISPNVGFTLNTRANSVDLVYNYPKSNGIKAPVAPVNTGFGVSYVLSVIVALLVTKPGGLVIIENPEAHIHPSGQSALMELIAIVAQNGVQVIVETHSDHIVFGGLVNMKKGRLAHNKLIIQHFDTDDEGKLDIKRVRVGDDCRIKNAPRHFVEQMNLDLDVLFDM